VFYYVKTRLDVAKLTLLSKIKLEAQNKFIDDNIHDETDKVNTPKPNDIIN